MTPPPSGRHRDQEPSPTAAEPTPGLVAEASGPHSSDREPQPPLLRVVRGEPSAEELAALTVVVAALSQRRGTRRPVPVSGWGSPARTHRRPLAVGADGWAASGRPW